MNNFLAANVCPVEDAIVSHTKQPKAKRKSDYEDPLERREFYELMQLYRHCPLTPVLDVVEAYEAVKTFIREHSGGIAAGSSRKKLRTIAK